MTTRGGSSSRYAVKFGASEPTMRTISWSPCRAHSTAPSIDDASLAATEPIGPAHATSRARAPPFIARGIARTLAPAQIAPQAMLGPPHALPITATAGPTSGPLRSAIHSNWVASAMRARSAPTK